MCKSEDITYFKRRIYILGSILEPQQGYLLFNGRIQEGIYCPFKKIHNFCHVIPLSEATSIFRGMFHLSM